MASNPPDIDTGPPPAVSSLRSRFEQLAQETSPNVQRRPISSHGLLTPEPTSPRPRAMSNTNTERPESQHLRSTSSSSDLKVGVKRPPPPPPPRGSKILSPSPSASPLLRPVPVPSSSAVVSNMSLSVPSPESPPPGNLAHHVSDEPVTPFSPGGVASLRNKFSATTPAPPNIARVPPPRPPINPRPSFTGMQPASYSEQNLATANAPILPQRMSNNGDSLHVSRPTYPLSSSPDHFANSNSSLRLQIDDSASSSHSPFSDSDSDPSPSPPPSSSSRNRTSPPTNGVHHRRHTSFDTSSPYSSGPSYISSESDSSINKHSSRRTPPRPPRPAVPVPPRPSIKPPVSPSSATSSLSSTSTLQNPPRLPVRRSTLEDVQQSPPPPRVPARPITIAPSDPHPSSVPAGADRKAVGAHRLPPPPTRTIALGDKLPPARRPPSPSSDEESGDEEDKTQSVDALPDTSRSSRRPPVVTCFNYSEMKIHVPAYSGHVVVSGQNVVVAHHHHMKGYDLSLSDAPLWNLDTKELGKKDVKVTCMEFRAAKREAERGAFVWAGTKEGHLFEVDVRTGSIVGAKLAAHLNAISHIFRHGRSMLTVDEAGKVLVFEPGVGDPEDVRLSYTQPRVIRIAEKQEFIKLLAGKFWTSTRADMSGAGMARTPIIRIYDPFILGSVGRSVLPSEHVGAVTAGTILPSQPDYVYLGHEGGFISIWSIATRDGIPQCVEVMKVSSSDVLSLDGVNERLWAGGRQGMISAYDVAPRPWVVTNSWMAHSGLPVLKLTVDPYSIEKAGRLCVVSIGRDEQLRFWDGLLGSDWVDQELLKRERSFSTFRDINVLIVSWNVDAAKPDALNGDPVNINFLQDVLSSVDCPDVISFGFQEVIDLESRKMAAKTVLLGGKKKGDDGKISEKVSSAYKRWHDRLLLAVRLAMPPDAPYTVIHTENLVGLFSCMFVKNTERISLKDVAITTIKRGMGGRYGNKGGIIARFVIDDSSICLINCHLAAGQHHVRQRNADVAAFLEAKSIFPATNAIEEPLAYVGGGDGSMVLDHEIVFVNGDMNYRIDQRRDAAVAAIKANDWNSLLVHDQLTKEIKFNRGFRFRSFLEGPLTFAPTYKYDRRTNEFDSSEKRRVPAWCDRVLWRSRDPSRVSQLHYKRWEANVSDHRPISAGFTMTVKSVRHEVRARAKAEVEAVWIEHQKHLLAAAYEFYVAQALI